MICKLCGHHADHHRLDFTHDATIGPVVCEYCPDRRCQNGPDGEAYRQRSARMLRELIRISVT